MFFFIQAIRRVKQFANVLAMKEIRDVTQQVSSTERNAKHKAQRKVPSYARLFLYK